MKTNGLPAEGKSRDEEKRGVKRGGEEEREEERRGGERRREGRRCVEERVEEERRKEALSVLNRDIHNQLLWLNH